MKKFDKMFILMCWIGMIFSLVALFQSTNNDQILLSIWMFIAFGIGGTVVLLKQRDY